MDLDSLSKTVITQKVNEAQDRAASDTASASSTAAAESATRLIRTPAPTAAVRELNAPFQVDPDWPALVTYTIELSVTAPLLSTQLARVRLFKDSSDPPTTDSGKEAYLSSQQLAGLSVVSMQTIGRQQITAWVLPGEYLELVTSGTGSVTFISGEELVFNG